MGGGGAGKSRGAWKLTLDLIEIQIARPWNSDAGDFHPERERERERETLEFFFIP